MSTTGAEGNSLIPIIDTKPNKELRSSDQNLFQPSPSVTRLPSFKHTKPNRQKLSLTTRKCLSSNVTPISSPIIPRSVNNNYRPPDHEFSKEVIESSAKLIDDIDITLSQLSKQYYSDNNNLFESSVVKKTQHSDTSPTSLQNNNGISHFSNFATQSCDCKSMSRLKLKSNCPHGEDKTNAPVRQSGTPTRRSLDATEISRPTRLPINNHNNHSDLSYYSINRDNGRKSTRYSSRKYKVSAGKQDDGSHSNPSYTETWIYSTQEKPPDDDNESRRNSQSALPVYQANNNTHLFQKSIFTQHRHSRGEINQPSKYTPKIPLPNRKLKNLTDESVTNRDSGIYLSCSKDSSIESTQDAKVTNNNYVSPIIQPQPPPRISSLVNPSQNSCLTLSNQSSPSTMECLETPKLTSKVDHRKIKESISSVKQIDENKTQDTIVNVTVEGYCSDVDNLKNSGYYSDHSGYMSESGVGLCAQKMQQRFREGLLAVEESLQATTHSKIVAKRIGSFERGDISSTSSDEIEDYLRELSNRLECPNQFGDPKNVADASVNALKSDKQSMAYSERMEKYICDVDPASDFDITSSCSMDLLTGKPISDDDSIDYKHLRRIDLKKPTDMSDYAKYPLRKSSVVSSSRTRQTQSNGKSRPGFVEILEAAGPTPAIFEDVNPLPISNDGVGSHYRAMSLPGRPRPSGGWAGDVSSLGQYMPPLPPPPPLPLSANNHVYYEVPVCRNRSGRSGGSCTPSLLNVRLPYATSSQGVKNSSSTTSLGKRDSDTEDAYDGLGSHLSLLSTGSYRSLNEERQATEIRKLRRELEIAQSKVRTLSGQLSNNGTLVAAFEGTLQSMSMRLQKFAASSESKESELSDLKNTIESLKKQAGSSPIPDPSSPKIYSSSSLTSLSSNSNSNEKRSDSSSKKSSWFKTSLGRAFKKKSSKDDGSTESINDLSRSQKNVQSMMIESESMQAMRKELEEKDARLTDVQLDALSRSHQLEQLRDQLTKMRYEMSSLKADNSRLQCLMTTSNGAVSSTPMDQSVGADSTTDNDDQSSTLKAVSSRFKDMNVRPKFDFLNGLVTEIEGAQPITVYLPLKNLAHKTVSVHSFPAVDEATAIPIGRVGINSMTSWSDLENSIRRLLKEYVSAIDPISNLGLNGESVARYRINGGTYIALCSTGGMRPLTSPQAACDNSQDSRLYLDLKNHSIGNSIDDIAFEFLIPKPILLRYFGLLLDHRRIILSGPSGTGKSFLANKLARNLATRYNRDPSSSILVFNLDKKSTKELRNYLTNLTDQLLKTDPHTEPFLSSNSPCLPLVIILDNLHNVSSYSEIFNSFLSIHHSRSPFVIGTMNQLNTLASNNLQLHHNFRWVLCTNHMEPVKGFLGRYLRRQFLKHQLESRESHDQLYHIIEWISIVWQHINKFLETYSSPDVTIGPRLFLNCPMSIETSKTWFIDLWNYSLVPYILDAVRDGLNTHGRKQATWDDPTDWIIRSWPWNDPYNSLPINGAIDTSNLIRLRSEDVGFDSYQLITTTSAHIGPYSLSSSHLGADPLGGGSSGRHSLMIERRPRGSDKLDCNDNVAGMFLQVQERNRRKK